MTKQYKTRLSRIVFFAALAFTFWLFDLMFLAWIFAALVIVPLVVGFGILVFRSAVKSSNITLDASDESNQKVWDSWKKKEQGAYQPNVDNTTKPPSKRQ